MGKREKSSELVAREAAIANSNAESNVIKLPEEVAAQYNVRPGAVRVFFSTKLSKTIDLNKIDLATAEKLDGRKLIKKENKDQAGS